MASLPPSGPHPGLSTESGVAAALIEELAGQIGSLAVLLDFDGTLSPIVDDPAAAAPDPGAAAALARLVPIAGLVACVTGRPALLARELLGQPGIAYSGLHGAQRLAPGAATPETPPAFAADAARIADLVESAATEPQGLAGLDVEHKGPIIALHWRRAADPERAAARAEQLAERATAAGLRTGTGRSVLELRPALEITKGDAARALLAAAEPAPRHVLFAGDDVTDLDAFTALRELHAAGELDSVTLIAVAGAGAPPAVAEAADLTVASPAQLGQLLAQLADADADADAADASARSDD